MRRIICTVLTFVMLTTIAPLYADDSEVVNPSFDFSGVEEFWKVADILKADQEPPAAQWQKLFDTPGYVVLIKMEVGNADIFKNALRAAFMPSQAARAMEMLAAAKTKSDMLTNYKAYMITAYKTADFNHKALTQYIAELKSYPYTQLAIQNLVKFLPVDNVKSLPKIAFIVHHASTDYTPTIIGLTGLEALAESDIKRLNSFGKDKHWPFVLEMARRSFLRYRQQKLTINYPSYSERDFPMVRMIDQIAGEGIASQIDVRQMYFNKGCFANTDRAKELIELQTHQPYIMRAMDFLLSTTDTNSDTIGDLAMKTNELLTKSGIPVSYFMADTIIKGLGEDALSTVAFNPFAFFLLYDKAAKTQKLAPAFSEQSIKYLTKMEFKYKR